MTLPHSKTLDRRSGSKPFPAFTNRAGLSAAKAGTEISRTSLALIASLKEARVETLITRMHPDAPGRGCGHTIRQDPAARLNAFVDGNPHGRRLHARHVQRDVLAGAGKSWFPPRRPKHWTSRRGVRRTYPAHQVKRRPKPPADAGVSGHPAIKVDPLGKVLCRASVADVLKRKNLRGHLAIRLSTIATWTCPADMIASCTEGERKRRHSPAFPAETGVIDTARGIQRQHQRQIGASCGQRLRAPRQSRARAQGLPCPTQQTAARPGASTLAVLLATPNANLNILTS